MNIDKKIKQLGIEKLGDVDDATKRNLANMVSISLTENFRDSGLNKELIEEKLINTNMYIANTPQGMSKANYIYMNSSIYFDKSLDLNKLNDVILHECIHKIQEYKDKKNKLIQLGICDFKDTKIVGLAFNEAAIQYIVSKILHNERKIIRVYGIDIPTISRNYYAMVTNLIEQIVYLIGDETLVNSTINCNDEFIYECIDNFGEKNFIKIRNNFDRILSLKDCINNLFEEHKEREQIEDSIRQLEELYFSTQELILTSNSEVALKIIDNLQDLEEYKEELLHYSNLIGKNEKYDFFEKFYEAQYDILLEKEKSIKEKTSLMVISDNPIIKAFRIIKKLFIKPDSEYNK